MLSHNQHHISSTQKQNKPNMQMNKKKE